MKSTLIIALCTLLMASSAVSQEKPRKLRLRGSELTTRDNDRNNEIRLLGLDETDQEYRADLGLYRSSATGPSEIDNEDLRNRTLALYAGSTVHNLPEVVTPKQASLMPRSKSASSRREAEFSDQFRQPIWYVTLLLILGSAVAARHFNGPPKRKKKQA
jgi:hypothetical protein